MTLKFSSKVSSVALLLIFSVLLAIPVAGQGRGHRGGGGEHGRDRDERGERRGRDDDRRFDVERRDRRRRSIFVNTRGRDRNFNPGIPRRRRVRRGFRHRRHGH